MSVPFSNTKLRVPRGFQNLLEGLAREVLRAQPDDIYAFGAVYFENLLAMRDQGGVDPALEGAQLEDRFYNNQSFKKPDVDASDPQQQEAATRIQTKYRQYHAKREVQHKREEKAAIKIQAGFRGMHDRHKVKEQNESLKHEEQKERVDGVPMPDDKEDDDIPEDNAETGQDLEVDQKQKESQQEDEEYRAASAFQRSLKDIADKLSDADDDEDLIGEDKEEDQPVAGEEEQHEGDGPAQDESKPEEKSEEMTEAAGSEVQVSKDEQAEQDADTQEAAEESHSKDINLEDPDVEKAATTIQAGFKGMKARQEVKALKESRSPEEDSTEAVQESQEQEDKKDISYDDPEVEQAATKIQSGFRGMKARREVQELKESKLGDSQENVSEEQADKEKESTGKEETQETAEETQAETGEAQPEHEQEDKVQIDTEDPDVQAAATKIQAGFRGYQTRKEMKEKTDVPADTQEVTDEQTDNQPDDTPATESTEQKPE